MWKAYNGIMKKQRNCYFEVNIALVCLVSRSRLFLPAVAGLHGKCSHVIGSGWGLSNECLWRLFRMSSLDWLLTTPWLLGPGRFCQGRLTPRALGNRTAAPGTTQQVESDLWTPSCATNASGTAGVKAPGDPRSSAHGFVGVKSSAHLPCIRTHKDEWPAEWQGCFSRRLHTGRFVFMTIAILPFWQREAGFSGAAESNACFWIGPSSISIMSGNNTRPFPRSVWLQC